MVGVTTNLVFIASCAISGEEDGGMRKKLELLWQNFVNIPMKKLHFSFENMEKNNDF